METYSDPQIAHKIPEGNWRRQYNSAYLLDRTAATSIDTTRFTLASLPANTIPLRNIFPLLGIVRCHYDAHSTQPGPEAGRISSTSKTMEQTLKFSAC
jgi:hypothetical protein